MLEKGHWQPGLSEIATWVHGPFDLRNVHARQRALSFFIAGKSSKNDNKLESRGVDRGLRIYPRQ